MSFKKNLLKYYRNISINAFQMLWNDIRESISGTNKDFTTTKLSKAILLLSIPMVLEMVMESIFAIVDTLFISKLGTDAIATVGVTEALLTIIYAVGMGLSIGTSAMVARRIGEKKPYRASVIAVQAIIVGSIVSLLIGIAGILFAKDLLKLMGANSNMIESSYLYTAILLGSNLIIMLLFIMNAVFRSSGDASISFRILLLANALNIILDPIFIFGLGPIPALGIKGAAIATSTGRGVAVICQIYLLLNGKGRIRIYQKAIKLNLKVMLNLIKISLGGILQSIIAIASWIGMIRIIAMFGSVALAGYTIAIRIVLFVILPSWGVSNAAATLVGQNLGANKPDRAEKAVWIAGYVNIVLLGLISIILISWPRFFIGLFTTEIDVINTGSQALRIISYGFVFYAIGMVMIQSFNGAGDTRTPSYINLVCFWLIEIPLAYFLSKINGVNENGVYFALIIAEALLTIAAMWLFKKGNWKNNKV